MGFDLKSTVLPEATESEHEAILERCKAEMKGKPNDPEEAMQFYSKIIKATSFPNYGYYKWNIRCWPEVLRIANDYGWEPKKEVNYYLTNEGHRVDEKEAAGIAEALQKYLQSNERNEKPESLNPVEWPNFNERVSEFIGFCKAGGFEIC